MNEHRQLQHFIDLLAKTGIGKERVEYWIQKISGREFTEKDEALLTQELEEQLLRIDEAIGVTELEIEAKEKELHENEAKTLPYLEKLAKEQPEIQKREEQDYKEALSKGEKEALDKLEGLRGEKESSEIEAIRKRLGKK